MALEGPLVLPIFSPSSSKAPTPILKDEYGVGQLLACSKTGRMWMVGKNDANTALTVRQVLPVVRNTSGTIETKLVNTSGNFEIVAAGTSASAADFFGALSVSSTGEITVGLNDGMAAVVGGQLLTFSPPQTFKPTNLAAQTINSSNPQSPTAISFDGNTYLRPSQTGQYLVEAHLTFYHNNAYEVTAAITLRRTFGTSTTTYSPVSMATVSSGAGGGYRHVYLRSTQVVDINVSYTPAENSIVIEAIASDPSVQMIASRGTNYWACNPQSPDPSYILQYESFVVMTRVG